MCNQICKQITLVLAALLVAHLIPKKSHWRLTGHASPNSVVKWMPDVKKSGMVHLHFVGDGTLVWGSNKMKIENHTFFHMFGEIPEMRFISESTLKAEAHLFV